MHKSLYYSSVVVEECWTRQLSNLSITAPKITDLYTVIAVPVHWRSFGKTAGFGRRKSTRRCTNMLSSRSFFSLCHKHYSHYDEKHANNVRSGDVRL